MGADTVAETNWKHKVSPEWGDLTKGIDHNTVSRCLIKSSNLGNVLHKQGGIAETVKKCNGELGIKLAAILVAVILVLNQWGKAHWNANMCQYLHSHWEPIRLRNPNALYKSCWTDFHVRLIISYVGLNTFYGGLTNLINFVDHAGWVALYTPCWYACDTHTHAHTHTCVS